MSELEEAGAVVGKGDSAQTMDTHANSQAADPLDRALSNEYINPADVVANLAWPLRILTGIAALFMLSITGLTFVDVTGRYAFNSPVPGGVELIEFLLGLLIFSALPLVTVKRAHITVQLFDNFMSAAFKRYREVVVLIASAGMIMFITERMWATGMDMLENDDISLHLEVPTAPLLFVLSALSAVSAIVQIYMVWKYLTVDLEKASKPNVEGQVR